MHSLQYKNHTDSRLTMHSDQAILLLLSLTFIMNHRVIIKYVWTGLVRPFRLDEEHLLKNMQRLCQSHFCVVFPECFRLFSCKKMNLPSPILWCSFSMFN